jgi:uncharacterized protein YdiU (UPF0061 family)
MINSGVNAGWNLESSYSDLPGLFYSCLAPIPVSSPKRAVLNHSLAESLGLDPEALIKDEGIAIFAGNKVPPGSNPLAQAYAGHQFGYFTMLGDGRALLLGEQITRRVRDMMCSSRDQAELPIPAEVTAAQYLANA